jgi:ankyrin repeat protein
MSKLIFSYLFKTNLSTFRSAIISNNTNKICRILDVERDHICKEIDNAGNTALLLAINHASPLTVRLLIQQGAHPDQTNFLTFQTPLSLLASKIFEDDQSNEAKMALEMATILLDHGAYVDKPSPYMYTDEHRKDYIAKETPLMTAVRNRNIIMATLFLKRKADVDYIEKQSQNRP